MGNSNGASPNRIMALSKTVTDTTVEYEVVHKMAGRLRLRIPRLATDARFGQRVLESTTGLPLVQQVRVSARSSSLVVNYRTGAAHARGNGYGPRDPEAMLARVVECVRVAAGAESAQEIVTPLRVAANGHDHSDGAAADQATALPIGPAGGKEPTNYTKRLSLPVLGLGLSASVMAGVAVPGALVGGAILAAAYPIFKRTVQGIRDEKKLTVDFLDSLTIVLLTAQASFLAPAFIVAVIEGSEILRDWTAQRSKQASMSLVLSEDHQVLVERDGEEMWLSWDSIQEGDVIHLYPGDQAPVDGTVLDGSGLIDQHQLTGDVAPAARHEGDDIHASSLVTDGHLRIVAKSTGHDTLAATFLAMSEEAPDTDTRVSNWARKTGNWAVVPTLAAGAAVFAGSGSVARATAIVSLDLGTGMRVSAPIAVIAAQTNAAQNGILIRSGRALEMLAQVDTVVFDKTATLTEGRVQVDDVRALHPGIDADTVIELAASAEHALNHPLARAVARYAEERGIHPRPTGAWDYRTGQGVVTEIDGEALHVGSRRLMEAAGIAVEAADGTQAANGATHIYVARGGELVGVILCNDPVRHESAEVVSALRGMNIAPLMVSGDGAGAARATAAGVGISQRQVYAPVLPQQKAELVRELQKRGRKVAFVGDGINDAAALAQADVSISLGSATDLARATADVVLLNNDLHDLLAAIELGRQTVRILKQNQALVVVPNVGAIAYGMLAVMSPTVGVVINNGSAVAAALNSLRPLKGSRKFSARKTTKPITINHQTNPTVIDA